MSEQPHTSQLEHPMSNTTPATETTTVGPETVLAYKCTDCETLHGEGDLERAYTCNECGQNTLERRCDTCNKFTARAEHQVGCPDDAAECEEVEAVTDLDGELILAEDYDPSVPLSERKAANIAAATVRNEVAAAAKRDALFAKSTQVPAAQIVAGDRIIVEPPAHRVIHPEMDTYTVKLVRPDVNGRTVFIAVSYGSSHIIDHAPDDLVRRTGTTTVEPFGQVTVTTGDLGNGVSTPFREVWVQTGYGTRENGLLPHLTIGLASSNRMCTIGSWWDRDLATVALDQLDHAARPLADLQGVTYNPAPRAGDVEHIPVADNGFTLNIQHRAHVEVTIGDGDRWMDHQQVMVFRADGGLNSTSADPNLFGAAVAAARALLPTLTGVARQMD